MSTILVVDDTAVDRRIAGGLLKQVSDIDVQYAADGVAALESMQQSVPDLVLTDMQMPEMNGLELVNIVRMQYPDVPVILMTAQGSEALAVEALSQGASSYVPKSHLGERLQDTVKEVLSVAHADKTYTQLMKCQDRIEFSYSLDNDLTLIDSLINLIQQIIEGMEFTDHTGKCRIGVAVREALSNALYRGNLELAEHIEEPHPDAELGKGLKLAEERRQQPPYRDRKIHVEVRIDGDEARFLIRDDGPGFDHAAVSDLASSLDADRGRGLVLMRSFMDSVHFNDTGNEVTLVKRRDRVPNSSEQSS